MASNTITKQEKCYNPLDLTFKFVDREDDLDFLCEGFKSLRAQMSCGHAVTPTSLTNWCRRLLEQGESRFVCGGFGCSAEWTLAEVVKMALLTPEETEYFRKTLEFNAARQMLIIRFCPSCGSAVTRENESDLNVLCKKCTAVKGQPFEFCWQCLREWKGARPRKDRCGNRGCCNQSLKTLKECPDIIFDSVKGVNGCPSVRACPTCGLLVEHSKRHCKSLVCPRCKVKFCFVCLKIFTECTRTSGISAPCSSGVAPRQTAIPVWQKK
ncbi:probable E3 ubiquitin-protein ligase RNF144A-A isoform X2 [Oreochromis aureus]|nr:probable E3 ubiquitin-protein ligase RNF144A-A isoform X2 [Oreochromis aureus]